MKCILDIGDDYMQAFAEIAGMQGQTDVGRYLMYVIDMALERQLEDHGMAERFSIGTDPVRGLELATGHDHD